MNAQTSPEEPGKKGRPRRIDGPTATSSQPESQPQMAHSHDNGDVPRAQSTVVSESGDPLLKLRRKKTSSSGHCASTVSVISHHARDTNPSAASTREKPTPMGQENDGGCSCSDQQPRSKEVEDDARPRVEGSPETWPTFPFFQTRPLTPIPVTKSQRCGEATVQANDVKGKKKRTGGFGIVAPELEVIRVLSNPGLDGENRLQRAFALLFRQAVKDRQDTLDEDYAPTSNSHQTP